MNRHSIAPHIRALAASVLLALGAAAAAQTPRFGVREDRIEGLGERVRDVRQGPDGLLYLLTDSAKGRLVRVLPR